MTCSHARIVFSSALHDCMDSTDVPEKPHDHSVRTTRVTRMVADLKHHEGLLYSSFVLGWHRQKINSILERLKNNQVLSDYHV